MLERLGFIYQLNQRLRDFASGRQKSAFTSRRTFVGMAETRASSRTMILRTPHHDSCGRKIPWGILPRDLRPDLKYPGEQANGHCFSVVLPYASLTA